MRLRVFLGVVAFTILVLANGPVTTSAGKLTPSVAPSTSASRPLGSSTTYIPMISRSPAVVSTALVIDHTMTDLAKIPAYWLTQAKRLTMHYAHTSHGSQLMTGAQWWELQNATYNIDVRVGGTPALPPDTAAFRIYDGNNPDTYITPELYWSTDDGKNRTRSVANTGLFNYSMWAWCGQQSSNSTATVQEYLDTMNQFEQQYPAMRFIYMTGHTDGTGPGGTLFRNNDQVRQYVRNNNKVLFDFADIETYNPSGGGPYYNDANGYCQWCDAWCTGHPSDCANFNQMGDCAHTHKLFCRLKGAAFWWMMARLAGWSGVP